jgi:hypothetical protein
MRACRALLILHASVGASAAAETHSCEVSADSEDHTSLLQEKKLRSISPVQNLQSAGQRKAKSSDEMYDQAVALLKRIPAPTGSTDEVVSFVDSVIQDIIGDENGGGVLADILKAHELDQAELNRLSQLVVDREAEATTRKASLEGQHGTIAQHATTHSLCRIGDTAGTIDTTSESALCGALEECETRLNTALSAYNEQNTIVESLQAIIQGGNPNICQATDSMELTFRTQFRLQLQNYLSAELTADTLRSAHATIETECNGKRTAVTTKSTECDQYQATFEMDSCTSYHDGLAANANPEFGQAVQAYNLDMARVRDAESLRKGEYTTLQRTRCLLEAIHTSSEIPCDTQAERDDVALPIIDGCHSLPVDTTHLDVTYTALPQEPAIPTLSLASCTPAFTSQFYALLVPTAGGCGGVSTCSPCQQD